MESAITNLDKVNHRVRNKVAQYCQRLIDACGERIKSIFLYGSVTGPDYVHGRSNVNIVVVVDSVDQDLLDSIHKVAVWGRKHAVVAPLVLTHDYIKASIDTFPIEFLEIAQSGVVVYGQSLFDGLIFENEKIRHECEFQARSALLRFQQAYLEIGRDRKGIENLLHTSINSLIPLLRAMLRIKAIEPPNRKIDLVKTVADKFGIDTSILVEILRDKAGDERIGSKRACEIVGDYLKALQSIVSKIDQLRV